MKTVSSAIPLSILCYSKDIAQTSELIKFIKFDLVGQNLGYLKIQGTVDPFYQYL